MADRVDLFARWRQRRLERAQLRLKDAVHDLRTWGFAMTPSREARAERRIDKARQRVVRLGGDTDGY